LVCAPRSLPLFPYTTLFRSFVVGIARLSSNWLIARLATVYVETLRNIPLLLQLMFWYFAVLKNLPGPRQSIALPGGGFLNVRGRSEEHTSELQSRFDLVCRL